MSGPSVKVPSEWLDSDSIEDLGADTVLLMITALGWSATQTSDGIVPRRQLRKLWPVPDIDASIAALVKAGEVEDRGGDLHFLNWEQFILSEDEVDRIRAMNRERDERRRRHNRGDHSMCRPAYCNAATAARETTRESHVVSRVSHAAPTRSAPTAREGRERGAGLAGASAPPVQPDKDGRVPDLPPARRLPEPHAKAPGCCNLVPNHPVHAAIPDGTPHVFVPSAELPDMCGRLVFDESGEYECFNTADGHIAP